MSRLAAASGRAATLRLVGVLAFGFTLTLTSNVLEPGVLGYKVLQLVPRAPSTALGFTTFAGLVVAMAVQPVVGWFSDRTRSRWGRRLPYFAVGSALTIACLYLIAAAPALGVLVAGVLLIQVGSNTVQAPSQAMIPDHVPSVRRGRVSGLKAMLDIGAFVIGRLTAGILLGFAGRWGSRAVMAAVAVPSAALVLALVVTALWAREGARPAPPRPPLEKAKQNPSRWTCALTPGSAGGSPTAYCSGPAI